MDTGFKAGYDFFRQSAGSVLAAFEGEAFASQRVTYVASVDEQIDELEKNINSFAGVKTEIDKLKGDIAEYWHAGTFNVNAAANESSNRAFVERSHGFGSVDISTNFGNDYGLKYYKSAAASAKEQSKSIFERFKEYQGNGGKDSLDKFLADRNYDTDAVINDPIYSGQIRIIPCDQLADATEWLKEKIGNESIKRPEQVHRYEETLKMLQDRINDNKGNTSIPLSKKDAEKLAQLAKEDKFKAVDFGIEAPDVLDAEMVMKESFKAGTNAAIITLALKVGPEVYKAIDVLIKSGEIEKEQFKQIGFAAMSGSAEGFVRGSVASALTTCCRSGILGSELANISPSVISAVTVITMNAIKNSYQVVQGRKSRTELSNDLVRDVFFSTSSLAAGSIGQAVIPVPVVGYMIGSFVGSLAGSFVYNAGQHACMSFCTETGITMFGLVEQDYRLPEDIIKDIGIETFEYESFEPDSFDAESFQFDSFDYDTIQPDNLGIKFLRRGVIGVSKVGYTA